MSTPTSPTNRPMQAPMSSMGTNTPEEMAEPAAHGAAAWTGAGDWLGMDARLGMWARPTSMDVERLHASSAKLQTPAARDVALVAAGAQLGDLCCFPFPPKQAYKHTHPDATPTQSLPAPVQAAPRK